MCPQTVLLSLALVSLLIIGESYASKLKQADDENCEVCVKFINRFIASLKSDEKTEPAKIEKAFKKFCKPTKKDDNRFCYYVGGLEESATSILGEVSKPISWSMPAEQICLKLYRRDSQICDLRYEKAIDLAGVNLKKLKVKDLKQILSDWEEACRGCTEKTDYINLIEELMPKYAPESAAKRRNTEL